MFDKIALDKEYKLLDLDALEDMFAKEEDKSSRLYDEWKETNQKAGLMRAIISWKKNQVFNKDK